MSSPVLLVDGRVLNDDHPGVRRFWVPILCAWATLGGRGLVAHRRGCEPDSTLITAGFSAVELRHSAYDPRGIPATRRIVRQSATATLSPLYLTLDGAARNVATVFDLIGRLYPRSLRSRLLWEVMMWRTVRAASRVVCATNAIGNALVETFPGLRSRLALVSAVAPLASGRQGSANRLGLAHPYALVVASHRPHKRLGALAAAWRANATGIPLVMLGLGTEQLHAPPLIHGLGFVSDAEVDAWLAGAACVVSASLAEGFGLPILAALSVGVPVVATFDPALEEIGGDALSWAEQDDVDGLVRAAHAIITDPSAAGGQVLRGLKRAQSFTATQAAQQLARVIE